MDIMVLGTGCSRCESTIHRIELEAAELGISVIIKGTIVHSGGIPSIETVRSWLR